MSAEDDVRKASDRFYGALNRILNGDATEMDDAWSQESEVSTMHPLGGRQVGWDEVRTSWQNVANISSNGQVNLRDQRICVGNDLAYESGTEHVHASLASNEFRAEFRVTNIYRRAGGEWKMIHHHADRDQKVVEIVSKL